MLTLDFNSEYLHCIMGVHNGSSAFKIRDIRRFFYRIRELKKKKTVLLFFNVKLLFENQSIIFFFKSFLLFVLLNNMCHYSESKLYHLHKNIDYVQFED